MFNLKKTNTIYFEQLSSEKDSSYYFGDDSDEFFAEQAFKRRAKLKKISKIIIYTLLITLLLFNSPIFASYITVGTFAVFIFNNRSFFLSVLLLCCIICLIFKKLADNKLVRTILSIGVFIAVLYYITIFLKFYKVEASVVYCFGDKFPYRNLILWSNRNLERVNETNWFYTAFSSSLELFKHFIKFIAEKLKTVDIDPFNSSLSQLRLFDISKSVFLYIIYLLFAGIVLILASIIEIVFVAIAITIPYAVAFLAAMLINRICEHRVVGNKKTAKHQ